MKKVAAIGEEHRVIMAFEPEVSNVIDSAKRARKMLDEVGSNALKVVMDGAKYFSHRRTAEDARNSCRSFRTARKRHRTRACQGPRPRRRGRPCAAGEGLLDYEFYMAELKRGEFQRGDRAAWAWRGAGFLGVLSL